MVPTEEFNRLSNYYQGKINKAGRLAAEQQAQPASYEGTEEPEGMADAPIERLLKDIIKKQAPK